MRVKLEWLNDLVDLSGLSTKEIVDTLSLYSIEVEGVEKVVSGTNLVVGYVESKVKHPDSDHLSICMVNVGSEVLQIICGAANVDQGQSVIVATNGAILPNGLKIKRTKIRGVESNGMICSLSEIGLEKKFQTEEEQKGIYVFKDEVTIGSDALETLYLDDDVIELGLTPNRGDLLSMFGVALEVSAVFKRPFKPLAYKVIEEIDKTVDAITVINQDNSCIGYYAKVFRDIEIKPSPTWLKSRLIAFGVRPINNVVDITNYILALFGQPLHAFDYQKLGSKILVRKALKSEKIVTLDGVERTLEESDLVITDGINPVAIAGVMGGLATEITQDTKNIVLEAAVFDGESIRKTSQRLGLRSDSSIRFEKGVDITRTKLAVDYTSYLLHTYANAKVLKGEVFVGSKDVDVTKIKITEADVEKVLGIYISSEEIKDICHRLKFAVTDDLEVMIPNRRNDIKIKVDLIEEIARLYGYSHLPATLPLSASAGGLSNKQKNKRLMRNILNGLGLNEIITYSLVSEEDNQIFAYNHEEDSKTVQILMPLTNERKYLRKSLISGLINNAKYCYSRKIKDLATFEVGKVYFQKDSYQEKEMLSILLSNDFSKQINEVEKVDFGLIKGFLEVLFEKLKLQVTYRPIDKECPELHPKRSASIYLDDKNIGFVGCLHPKFAKDNDLDEIYLAEIKIEEILNYEIPTTKFQEISKVPSVERDIAVVVDKDVLAGDIITTIKNTDKKTLSAIEVFDVYMGNKVQPNQKSIAIKLVFTSFETLTDEQINKKVEKILKVLADEYQATLRS